MHPPIANNGRVAGMGIGPVVGGTVATILVSPGGGATRYYRADTVVAHQKRKMWSVEVGTAGTILRPWHHINSTVRPPKYMRNHRSIERWAADTSAFCNNHKTRSSLVAPSYPPHGNGQKRYNTIFQKLTPQHSIAPNTL